MTMHNRWEVFRGESQDEKDLIFRAKTSHMFQFRTELHVYLASNKGEELPDFTVKGSWAERSCTIYLGNAESNVIIGNVSLSKREKKIFC